MRLQKILVAGGGGFIGTQLANHLYRRGNHVRVADVRFNGFQDGPYCSERIEADLRNPQNCLTATKGMDLVYNLAANMGGIGFITEVGAEVMRDNLLINAHMLEACRINKIPRYLFTSSACVYPDYRQKSPEVKGLKETDAYPADPDSFYGWEKLATEKMCEAYQRDHEMNIRVARYHNIYGPKGTFKGGREKSPAALCRKVAESSDPGSITIWGDGRQTRSYCYIDDAIEATVKLMESDYESPINIGSERLVSINELADMIIRISGKRITKEHDLKAPQGVRGRNADISIARSELGWEPKVPLENGLATTYDWISSQLGAEKLAPNIVNQAPQQLASHHGSR